MLTGLPPSQHGIVANGWYFRDTAEIRFWQQANSLIQHRGLVYEGIETAKLFWWFNQHAPVRWSVTPKPYYGCDGSKVFDILDKTECNLTEQLGPFPFFSFWGPNAGLPASEWIANASALVIRKKAPELTLTYLPHLDYDYQRIAVPDHERVAEVDRCVAIIVDAAQSIGAIPVVVSEYGLVPVRKSVSINRALRRAGWLAVRNGPFGESLLPGDSKAFAVVDHQVAHLYVRENSMLEEVKSLVSSLEGVASVMHPSQLDLDHPRSGEWIVLADEDAWFDYYYWLDDALAPDFARTVDIHRKSGYDPVELFMTSKIRAMARLAQKKLGFRYKMDVIPLDTSMVQGSHGLRPHTSKGPLIIGPGAPADMLLFKDYVRSLVGR
ncbi:MAG TPA: alkaline phosphatase family protein, partial [Pirellula sp.]|nr:alkaline phosphatase family protein [Pirellula sp.]